MSNNHARDLAHWLRTLPGVYVGDTRDAVIREAYEHCPVRFPGEAEADQLAAFETSLGVLGYKIITRNVYNEQGGVVGHRFQLNLPEEPRG